jgi:hypothetical protein
MLGASQFVNVVLFQFSGPDNFSPARPALRSLSRSSASASFSSSCFRNMQINFKGAMRTDLRVASKCRWQSTNNPGGKRRPAVGVVYFMG